MTNPQHKGEAHITKEALLQLARELETEHLFSDAMDNAVTAFVGTRYGINKNAEQSGEQVSGENVMRRSLQAAFISYLNERTDARAAALSAICPVCKGSGEGKGRMTGLGPDDYEVDAPCHECKGTGELSAQESKPVAAWLVERVVRNKLSGPHQPAWWTGTGVDLLDDSAWTTDANNAIKFHSIAEVTVILMMLYRETKRDHSHVRKDFTDRFKATEHIWPDAAPSVSAQDAKPDSLLGLQQAFLRLAAESRRDDSEEAALAFEQCAKSLAEVLSGITQYLPDAQDASPKDGWQIEIVPDPPYPPIVRVRSPEGVARILTEGDGVLYRYFHKVALAALEVPK